jgi:uncharacterized membrane protein
MEFLWREFAKSNIISGLLAIAVWGAIIFLAVTSRDVPEVLVSGGLAVIGFFFGSKVGEQSERLRSEVHKLGMKEKDYNAWLQSHG